jgi:hypothetical protein
MATGEGGGEDGAGVEDALLGRFIPPSGHRTCKRGWKGGGAELRVMAREKRGKCTTGRGEEALLSHFFRPAEVATPARGVS